MFRFVWTVSQRMIFGYVLFVDMLDVEDMQEAMRMHTFWTRNIVTACNLDTIGIVTKH